MSKQPSPNNSRRTAYIEKLKDPRWQKLRLQVFERDEWACQHCYGGERTLHVHHLYYVHGREPWEYPIEALQTLCEDCHAAETARRPDSEHDLLMAIRSRGFSSYEVDCFAALFRKMPIPHLPEVVASAMLEMLTDTDLMNEIIDAYFDILRERREAKERGESNTEEE